MRRRTRVTAAAMLTLTLALAWATLPGDAQRAVQARRAFSYEQVFGGKLAPGVTPAADIIAPLPAVTGWADDDHYLEMRTDPADKQRKVFSVNASDGSATLYRDTAELRKLLPTGFDPQAAVGTTPDGKGFLFKQSGDLYFFDLNAKKMRQLTATPAEEMNPRLSPNGKWVAYTREHDLFAYDLDSLLERRYTTDGSDVVYNGWASWVYMEEILGRGTAYAAFWWSPDSTRLAFMRFDDSLVPTFTIPRYEGQSTKEFLRVHGEVEVQRYPKPGDPNPWVRMGVVAVADGTLTWMDFEEKADHYVAWPFWTTDGKTLTVQWMNRGQDTIRFFNCDPATGKKTQIFEERQPAWVAWFEDFSYLKSGSGFLLRSDVDGWDHLYLHGMDGRLKTRLTSGEWRVSNVALVDEPGGWVYFMARTGKPWDAHLWRVRLDGSQLQQITQEPGQHTCRLSPGGKYFIDTVSTISTPPVMALYRIDGTLVRKLGEGWTGKAGEYAWGKAELFTIKSEDGRFDLPAYWVLPTGFDPKKQYPVIVSIYGGPDAGTVRNAWLGLTPHYWAQRGVIYISADHRAGGAFGKKGVALMHRDLGRWEMADLIAVAKWLRTRSFVARDRIGITGSSYGGYTTTMALVYGADHFNFGVAGASVTDWRLYDSVYTERYMDTPKENPEGYRNGNVLTWIDRYRGGLRMTHGTIDDNVHMQNTLHVVDALQRAGKPFELMLYPNSRHGVQTSQRAHMVRESHEFWVRTLLGGRMPPVVTDTPDLPMKSPGVVEKK